MSDGSPLPTLVVIDPDESLRTLVRYAVDGRFRVVGESADGREGLQLVRLLRPDIVLMDLDLPQFKGGDAARIVTDQFPEVAVVVISNHGDFDRIRAAMTAGAKEYVERPFNKEALLECLDRTVTRHAPRKAGMTRAHPLPAEGLWCFLRGTGGVGQSTLILAMASELAELGRDVIVVDLESLFGNAAFYLGIEVTPLHLGDAIENIDAMSKATLPAHLKEHPSGFRLLAPPTSTLHAHEIQLEGANALIPTLLDCADTVLVDLPVGMPERYLPFLDAARFLFLCSDATYGAVKNLGVLLGLMEVLEYPAEKVIPLILKADPDPKRRREIESMIETAGAKAGAWIPRDDPAAALAIRRADTLPRVARRSGYTYAVKDYLADLLDLPKPKAPDGLLARFAHLIAG